MNHIEENANQEFARRGRMFQGIIRKHWFLNMMAILTIFHLSINVVLADDQIKSGKPGQNITLWYGVNFTGHIYLKIHGENGTHCANLWWIVMGIVKQIGRRCGNTTIDAYYPFVYYELRAGGFASNTHIAVSDQPSVFQRPLCTTANPCSPPQ